MKQVTLKGGKFTQTGEKQKGNGTRPPKYPFPSKQYDNLLAIAKANGLDIGETRANNTRVINVMAGLILDAFIAEQNKS